MLNLDKLQAVIFDWDNTLAETRTCLVKSINEVLSQHNLPDWDKIKNKRDNNLSFRDNFPILFGNKSCEFYDQYKRVYKKKAKELLSSYPFALEVIKFFKNRGVRVILMTNKDRELLELDLPMLFSPELFDKVVCGHEAQRDKPFPEHAFYSLEGFLKPEEITKENVWIIGDSTQDSDCAKAANALPIRIGEPIWKEDIGNTEGVLFFKNFKELLTALKG